MDNGVVIVERELVFVDKFESEFKDKKYSICRFVDPESLNVYNATNIDGHFEKGMSYLCSIAYKKNKLVVISAE